MPKLSSELKQRARSLRKSGNPYEVKLWNYLRCNVLGVHFRRQYPIPPYIADFACFGKKLIVEIDGESHSSQIVYDKNRDSYLQSLGYSVLRFTNEDVDKNIEGVLEMIKRDLEK